MNKAEFIAAVAAESGLSKQDAELAVNGMISAVTNALKKDQKVSIVGFLTAENHHRKASTGRNPRTGETIQIPAKNVAKFKAGKALNDALNS